MNRTPWSMATDGAGRDFSQTKLVGCHDNFSPQLSLQHGAGAIPFRRLRTPCFRLRPYERVREKGREGGAGPTNASLGVDRELKDQPSCPSQKVPFLQVRVLCFLVAYIHPSPLVFGYSLHFGRRKVKLVVISILSRSVEYCRYVSPVCVEVQRIVDGSLVCVELQRIVDVYLQSVQKCEQRIFVSNRGRRVHSVNECV